MTTETLSEQKSQSAHRLIERAPADFPFFDQMQLKSADIFGSGLFRGFFEECGEASDVVRVGVDGLLRQIPDGHILGHALNRRCGAPLPWCHQRVSPGLSENQTGLSRQATRMSQSICRRPASASGKPAGGQ